MATNRIAWGSGSAPNTDFYFDADVVETQAAPAGAGYGRWRIRFYARAVNRGDTGSYDNGFGEQRVERSAGSTWSLVRSHNGTPFLPSGYSNGQTRWSDGPYDVWVNANSDGYWFGTTTTMPLRMSVSCPSFSSGWRSGSITIPRIAQVPDAPTNNWGSGNPDQITPTSMRYRFAGGSNGGSTVLEWQAQRATDAAFTKNVQTVSSNGTSVFSGLNPNTRYYFRARGRNAVGWGPWGAQVNALTQPAGAPGLTVVPGASGLNATLTFAPPGTLPSPDGYTVERRKTGTTTPVTTLQLPGTPNAQVVSGLTAGTSYQWRAALKSGSYVSDFSAWVTAVQPQPNTSPGDFFDGSTPAKTDVTYSWDGTASNSTSKGTAKAPLGWTVVPGPTSGGTAVIYRATGSGRSGAFGARVLFTADCTGDGFRMGQGSAAGQPSAVAVGGVYLGSIHVQLPARSQRMAAQILWLDGAGALVVASAPGEAAIVPSDETTWARLIVQDTAPVGAVTGAVRAIDVTGAGWSTWKAGDEVVLDDAMMNIAPLYPYFDGDTPDTPQFSYSWLGTANASPSQRIATTQALVDPFADPDCDPIPAPPRPPVIDPDCIEEVGSWRRYWSSIPPQYVLDWLAELPTITLSTDANDERQIRIRIYENPDALDPGTFVADSWSSEQIISYMPKGAQYVLNGVDESMMGSVDDGATWTNLNHLLYGTGATPASWPVLRCGIGYLVSFDVPITAPPGNLSIDIALTRRY